MSRFSDAIQGMKTSKEVKTEAKQAAKKAEEEAYDARVSSRRGFFTNAVKDAAKIAVKEVERQLPMERRPPFAIAEPEFLATCTKGWECAKACPYDAIHIIAPPATLGLNTPLMMPDESPCMMCDGFPCAAACTSGALLLPKDAEGNPNPPQLVHLGVARLIPDLCFTFRGPECGACGRLCPPGAEGALTFRAGRPSLDESQCVGCGACVEACITTPKAIVLLSLEQEKSEREEREAEALREDPA
ncbi:MAG: hypothetical protein GY822_08005 [Deltaproteobacteria bacterium]|nr:hypothetical protein [Deltaproteobacteria bacterium]